MHTRHERRSGHADEKRADLPFAGDSRRFARKVGFQYPIQDSEIPRANENPARLHHIRLGQRSLYRTKVAEAVIAASNARGEPGVVVEEPVVEEPAPAKHRTWLGSMGVAPKRSLYP